jgi:hypothetical protein
MSSNPSDRRRQELLWEQKLRSHLHDPIARAQVRRSAQLAADNIWKAVSEHPFSQTGSFSPSMHLLSNDQALSDSMVSSDRHGGDNDNEADDSDGYDADDLSEQRAIRRGFRRGSRERNEALSLLRGIGGNDGDMESVLNSTTLTDFITEEGADRKKSRGSLSALRRRRLFKTISFVKTELKIGDPASGDPWMCGVCGKVFATLGAAERHEEQHLHAVVSGLGWNHTSGNDLHSTPMVSTPPDVFRRAGTPERHYRRNRLEPIRENSFGFVEDDWDDGRNPERPLGGKAFMLQAQIPVGTLVPKPRARTSSEVRFEPSTSLKIDRFARQTTRKPPIFYEDEPPLLISESLRDSIILADEALLDVCQKAESMILNKSEVQAELELAYLAGDKAYYDAMAARAVARKANPTDKYRSDGTSLLGKVQNKLVDAYEIMKEGDRKRGVTDQYMRKKKEGKGVELDIEHTNRTLYVNVMVRNSVRVVSHELQRLARKRWEETDKLENLGRFERFRVYAHHNMVRLAGLALASDFTVIFLVFYVWRCSFLWELPYHFVRFKQSSREESQFSCRMIYTRC